MRRPGVTLAVLLFSATLTAQSLPELFHKAKAEVKGESWRSALTTLDRLEVESAKPGNEAARRQLEAPMAFYRGVCEANLDMAEKAQADFERFLTQQPKGVDGPLDVFEEGDRGVPRGAEERAASGFRRRRR